MKKTPPQNPPRVDAAEFFPCWSHVRIFATFSRAYTNAYPLIKDTYKGAKGTESNVIIFDLLNFFTMLHFNCIHLHSIPFHKDALLILYVERKKWRFAENHCRKSLSFFLHSNLWRTLYNLCWWKIWTTQMCSSVHFYAWSFRVSHFLSIASFQMAVQFKVILSIIIKNTEHRTKNCWASP